MKPGQTCGSCDFFQRRRQGDEFGKCHANPPSVLGRNESTFADTKESSWCGQWKFVESSQPEPMKKNLAERVEQTGPVTGADAPATAPAPAPAPIVDIAPPTGTPPQPPKPRRGPKTT